MASAAGRAESSFYMAPMAPHKMVVYGKAHDRACWLLAAAYVYTHLLCGSYIYGPVMCPVDVLCKANTPPSPIYTVVKTYLLFIMLHAVFICTHMYVRLVLCWAQTGKVILIRSGYSC